jgi:protein gp37
LVEPFLDEKILVQPLRWRKPRKVFVCSQTDLFGEWVPDAAIDRVCAVMALTPHIYQVLTKRAARMLEWSTRKFLAGDVQVHANDLRDIHRIRCAAGLQGKFKLSPEEQLEISDVDTWPLPNVWLGVSVEDQKTADERIPPLLQTPAAVRFVSAEPLLGPVDLTAIPRCLDDNDPRHLQTEELRKDDPLEWLRLLRHGAPGLDLIIVGGESGPGARPMSPDWARSIRDQCQAAGVPFFFKQWGEWGPAIDTDGDMVARRLGKKAGRLLDGRTWDEFPP